MAVERDPRWTKKALYPGVLNLEDAIESKHLHTHFLACCQDTVANLVAKGYITMETTTSRLIITSLGQATVKGCVPVQNAANIICTTTGL